MKAKFKILVFFIWALVLLCFGSCDFFGNDVSIDNKQTYEKELPLDNEEEENTDDENAGDNNEDDAIEEEEEEDKEGEEDNEDDSFSLPIIYIKTPDEKPIETKEWLNKELGLGLSTISIKENGEFLFKDLPMDIRGRGNSTWKFPKKPYNIKLEKKQSLFGMPAHKKWVLLANYSDKSLVRTEFAMGLGAEVFNNMAWTPKLQSVILYLNDSYDGIYQIVEKIEIDKNRLDIDITSPNSKDFLLEQDQRDKENEYKFTTTKGLRLSWEKTTSNLADIDKINQIKNTIQGIEDLIFSYERFSEIESLIDIPSLIDWYFVNELTKNVDAKEYSSIFMYFKNGKLYMGPIWDFDLSSGNVNYYSCDDPTKFYVRYHTWISRLFRDPLFVNMVKTRWGERKNKAWDQIQKIQNYAESLNGTQVKNFERWPILGKYIWPNRIWPETYEEEIQELIIWLETRYLWMNEALQNLP